MKNKAPLALLEQVIMLLVLAVAAAVCLHLFASAGLQAEQNRLQDRAMEQVQNTAEVIKSHTGDMEKAALLTGGSYEDGVLTVSDSRFTVTAEPIPQKNSLLGMAKITAVSDGEILAQLTICWQEVGA